MITSLTKEQESNIEVYLNKWLSKGRRASTTDEAKAKDSVSFLYGMLSKTTPEIIFTRSPMEANLLIHKMKGKTKKDAIETEYFTRSILWIGYYGFYDYILNELFPEKTEEFVKFTEFLKHSEELFGVYMFDEVAIVCDFPEQININNNGQLHNSKGGSMVFRDGFSLFNLNGIAVPKEIAEVNPSDITKDMILKQVNADIRREIVRKVPLESLVNILDAKVIDNKQYSINNKQVNYELLTLDIGDGRVRPFLKMENPSLDGVLHIEGVKPDIKTVEEALAYRNGMAGTPADIS